MNIIEILAGVAAAVVLVLWARRQGALWESWVYAVGLLIASAIYVGVAMGSAQASVMAAAAGVFFFGLLARWGVDRLWVLALGWLLHVGWDLAAQHHVLLGRPPDSYAHLCIGFDLALALRATQLYWGQAPKRSPIP